MGYPIWGGYRVELFHNPTQAGHATHGQAHLTCWWCAQIVPTGTDGTNQVVSTYNSSFPDIVANQVEQSRHLLPVAMYSAFTRDADYKTALLGDNLHPNEAGYARMAEVWYAALAPFLR